MSKKNTTEPKTSEQPRGETDFVPATCSAVAKIMERIGGSYIEEVIAISECGMGFVIVSKGCSECINGILLRDDDLSHDELKTVANHVNSLLSLQWNAEVSHPTKED